MLKRITDKHHVAVAGIIAVQGYIDTVYGMNAGSGGVRITYSAGAVITLPGATVEDVLKVLYG